MPTGKYTAADLAQPTGGEASGGDTMQGGPPTLSTLKDLGVGALKGIDTTISGADEFARKHLPAFMTNTRMGFGKPADLEAQKAAQQPTNAVQSVGKGIEQAGEFMLPGMGEEKIGAAAGKFAPLAKVGYNALTTGGLNKLQGGDFGVGAAAAGAGSAIGQGIAAAAPKLAESAIGITKADRGFGKNPGQAIINDTRGIRPETIERSAQGKISSLSPQLESAASGSNEPASLLPARQIVGKAINTASERNAAGTAAQLDPLDQFLKTRFDTGRVIPEQVPASELLNLRRGFNDEFGHWNPETLPGVSGTGRQAYHALTDEFHRAVPGTEDIDERISNLIPVVRRSESTSRAAPLIQRTGGRIAAHTGGLAMAGIGAAEGRHEGGLPGMIVGGTAGLLAPELLATPEGRMIAARTMASPTGRAIIGAPVKGGLLQLNRKDEQ
jgi:hypothetical protein